MFALGTSSTEWMFWFTTEKPGRDYHLFWYGTVVSFCARLTRGTKNGSSSCNLSSLLCVKTDLAGKWYIILAYAS